MLMQASNPNLKPPACVETKSQIWNLILNPVLKACFETLSLPWNPKHVLKPCLKTLTQAYGWMDETQNLIWNHNSLFNS